MAPRSTRRIAPAVTATLGTGDGPLATGLEPPPANLTDRAALRDQSPLDYYRRITIGVVGTAMPAFETRLSPDDRWAAAVYATLLRLPPHAGDVPAALQSFATTGRMSDTRVAGRARGAGHLRRALARVAAVRAFQPDATADANARVFSQVRLSWTRPTPWPGEATRRRAPTPSTPT